MKLIEPFWEILILIHIWLVMRYIFKAVFKGVYDYRFFKLLVVAFVPFAGYWFIMKKDGVYE
jgi:hypothetical protein